MPVAISDYLHVSDEAFEATGAFNALLKFDTRLFIDPHLLPKTRAPELRDGYEKLDAHFQGVFGLLRTSNREGDRYFNEAWNRLIFREVQGIAMGLTSSGTAGNGIGEGLSHQMALTAQRIIHAGAGTPRLFEVMGLFEPNIAEDRISDMAANILYEDLCRYTRRVLRDLESSGSERVALLVKKGSLPTHVCPVRTGNPVIA